MSKLKELCQGSKSSDILLQVSKNKKPKEDPIFRIIEGQKLGKADKRRATILNAAVDVIAKDGIESASFEAIGKAGKMTKAHVNYYFKEKPDLIEAVLVFVANTAQFFTVEALKKSTPKTQLSDYINITFDWAKKYPKHATVMMLLYYYCRIDKKLRLRHTEARKIAIRRLSTIIQSTRPKTSEKQATDLARTIQSLMAGNLLEFATTEGLFSLSQAKQVTQEQVKELLQ